MERNEIKNSTEPEIDLTFLMKILVKRKILIILGTILVTLVAIAASFIIKKTYESNGFFILSQKEPISLQKELTASQREILSVQEESLAIFEESGIILIPQYKTYYQYFSIPENFLVYLQNNEDFQERDDKNRIINRLSDLSIDKFNKFFSPVYAYSKKDLEELAQINQDIVNYVVGLRIKFEDSIPERAKYYVDKFGNYIRNCIINNDLTNYINVGLKNAKTSYKEHENEIIKQNFNLDQLELKKKDIEAIMKKYPESKNIETRQVISVEQGGKFFLSPVTQLVGIESYMADLNRVLEEGEREKEIEQIKIDYFIQAKSLLEGTDIKRQTQMLSELETILETVFKDKDLQKDTVRQVYNELNNSFDYYQNKYYERIRFSSEPEIPKKPSKPKKMMIIVLSFLLSLLFFILLAFICEWWENNRMMIFQEKRTSKP